MPKVTFAQNIQRHATCPPGEVQARTVRDALDRYFAVTEARARGYVLDDQGALRHHMVISVNGEMIGDRLTLSDPVSQGDEIHVTHALSGG